MNLGEISIGKDIGKHANQKYIWLACPECGKERWVTNTAKNKKGKKWEKI